VRIVKNSYGSASMTGALFVTRMLSIVGTTRRQGVALLDWLKRARHAFRHLHRRRYRVTRDPRGGGKAADDLGQFG
jgi:hypothetical protein